MRRLFVEIACDRCGVVDLRPAAVVPEEPAFAEDYFAAVDVLHDHEIPGGWFLARTSDGVQHEVCPECYKPVGKQ